MSQVELDPRNQEAITAALDGAWEKAATLNAALSEDYPDDSDVLNRLAKAYTELGQINKARASYEKVLEIDPYNPIAERGLDRLTTLRGLKTKETNNLPINPEIFLEELGKTKTVEVVDLAMPKVLVNLRVGNPISLHESKDEVTVISEDGHRLGKLEETWGKELAQAMNLGSEFKAVVKSTQVSKDQKKTSLSVFVREVKRAKKLINPPFPIETNNFTPYVRENALSYLKNEEQPLNEASGETEGAEAEDLPTVRQESLKESFEKKPPQQPSLVEDEEDHSST